MDNRLVLSIDPGKATGIAIGEYGPDQPYTLLHTTIVHDGIDGWLDWWDGADCASWLEQTNHGGNPIESDVIIEGFVLRDNGWLANLDGVEIIGSVKTLRRDAIIQLRGRKSLVQDQLLKDYGLWQTGKMVGHKDGRDANDAIIHGLAYLMATVRHLPTLRKYAGPGE